jgi:heterotetrameric sarcosine oxidase gamma subunit
MAQAFPELPAHSLPTPLQQAGLGSDALEGEDIALRELPDMTLFRLHTLEDPAALASRLQTAGVSLPAEVNEAEGRDPAVLCLRPREWLLLWEDTTPPDVVERIGPALEPALTALIDVSDGHGVFRLEGEAAPWLLAKLSGLDFLSCMSAGRHAARTRMADIAVVVHFHRDPDGPPRFDLVFDRSVAGYLWGLLNDAAPHAEELLAAHGAAS